MNLSDIEELYRVFPWPETPGSPLFVERLKEVTKIMKDLLSHEFTSDVLKGKDIIRVIDICSGIGVASFVLSKLLIEEGYEVKVTLVYVRKEILMKGKEWFKRELNLEPSIHVIDARRVHDLKEKYDIALTWVPRSLTLTLGK